MLTISQIKQLMLEYDFRPNKRLGQDFLIDKNIADKIIKAACINADDVILEIGAGLGNITEEIAKAAKRVIAIEFDKRLFEILKKGLGGYANCELICADILKIDFRSYAASNKLRVIGNIPYYITTPILERIIENRDCIKDALLMVQKEVAARMLAKSGSESYSSISCYIRYYTNSELKAIVKKTSFFPRPEVDSALIYLRVLDTPSVAVDNEELFFKIIRGTFNQRRKMLLSSLSNKKMLGVDKEQIRETLGSLGISPQIRPEELDIEGFARIANAFA